MAQGQYDHPSYITRQMDNLGVTTSGANGTSLRVAYAPTMRLRRVQCVVQVAGTATTNQVNIINLNGTTTTTVGSVVLSTSAVNTVVAGTDFNYTVPTGSLLYVTNGADATGVTGVTYEVHLDPLLGTWGAP